MQHGKTKTDVKILYIKYIIISVTSHLRQENVFVVNQ